MIALLNENGIKLFATKESVYDFVIGMSKGEKKYDDIVEWLNRNTK